MSDSKNFMACQWNLTLWIVIWSCFIFYWLFQLIRLYQSIFSLINPHEPIKGPCFTCWIQNSIILPEITTVWLTAVNTMQQTTVFVLVAMLQLQGMYVLYYHVSVPNFTLLGLFAVILCMVHDPHSERSVVGFEFLYYA